MIFFNTPMKILEASTLNPENMVKGEYFQFSNDNKR